MKKIFLLIFSIFLFFGFGYCQYSFFFGESISIEPADESISLNHKALAIEKDNYLKLWKNNADFEILNCALSELNCKNVDEGKSPSSYFLSISPFDYFSFFQDCFDRLEYVNEERMKDLGI